MNRPDEVHPADGDRIDEAHRVRVDDALCSWRQGDCVLGDQAFLFRLNPVAPISEPAAIAAADGVDAAEAQVHGFTIVTQTCDIVRACVSRPFVQVCPLVEVNADRLAEIRRGRRPNYAFLPGIAPHGLVADLDRVMTVEKAVVADWDRVVGAPRDEDVRRIRLPGAGLIFSSGNGRKWTEPSGKLLHDEVVPAQICRHRSVGLCGCEEAGNEGHEGRLAGRRTCAEHVAVESAHGRLAVPLSPRQLVGASSAATVGPAGSLAERWVWRLRGAPRSPAAARDHAGPGDGAAAMRTRGGDRRREQRRAAWWRSRRWRRNPRVAGSGGGGTARIECGPGARRRTGSG